MTVPAGPRRLPSVRARTALATVAVVGCALIVAGVVLIRVLSASLTSGVDSSARLRVEAVANLVSSGTIPPVLAVPGDDTVVVQILGSSGRVIKASDNVVDEHALITPGTPSVPVRLTTVSGLPVGDQDVYRVAWRTVATPNGTWTVVAAASLAAVKHTVTTLSVAVAAGIPLLLALVGVTAWLLAGRALAPVEAIRSQVAEISSRALDRRVPDPGGRDEVARLARTMNHMLARLEESQAAQRRFVANASHELRSPLTSALTQIQVDRAHPETADWQETAAGVETELERVQRLVVDLLALARSDEGALTRGRTSIDLRDLVREEADRQSITAPVPIDTASLGSVEIHANGDQIRQVVSNLIINGARHARTQVSIEARREGDQAVLTVSDDGPGIPAGQRQRVFWRFVRLDDARSRDTGGAGLGLAISKEIVEAHGGTIAVGDAQPGARFEIRLPAGPLPAEPTAHGLDASAIHSRQTGRIRSGPVTVSRRRSQGEDGRHGYGNEGDHVEVAVQGRNRGAARRVSVVWRVTEAVPVRRTRHKMQRRGQSGRSIDMSC